MEFCEYMKIKERMCKANEFGICGIACANCGLYHDNNGKNLGCVYFERIHPTEAEAIVQKWAEEHPEKPKRTRQSEFLKLFPEARKTYNDVILVAPCHIDEQLYDQACRNVDCEECRKKYWLQEIEEGESK